ncbi:MAG: phosphotransferase [Deltaproteobacteria bacterium]|nr:phosphotransferase [Deltaproteobacteria bacterium]
MQERLTKLLGQPVADIKKLFGDASYRTYWRIFLENQTLILMTMPKGKMSVSEEITNLKEKPEELPFINVQKYLASLQIPVPKIVLFSEADRWLILEDIGDTKFFDVVIKADEETKIKWYKKAIDLLVQLQQSSVLGLRSKNCIAFQRSYDATLFNWEFDHFWEYYVGTKDHGPGTEDQKLFKKEARKITEELCKLPQGFTHRDYQSRNLMVRKNQIYIIDFQDALAGPKVYDMVCLLRDSYVDVTPFLKELGDYYCEKSGYDPKKFWRAFHLQTVQRKLKDSGRFVFIDQVKKNPNFLPFIPLSMNYVKQALEQLPEYEKLYELLKKYFD